MLLEGGDDDRGGRSGARWRWRKTSLVVIAAHGPFGRDNRDGGPPSSARRSELEVFRDDVPHKHLTA